MRVATLDIGTNTVLLLIAETTDAGLSPLAERATITRLGEGVDRTRTLAPAAIERTVACLDTYAALVKELGVARVGVVATSAMRDASGGEGIRAHVRNAFGVEARVISGDEEARLTFLGALSGLDATGEHVVFDVGGGSTEVVRGTLGGGAGAGGQIESMAFAHSFDVGSVRLTERYIRSDPPSSDELALVTEEARRVFAPLGDTLVGKEPVGIAGTVTTLAAVALGLTPYDGARVHGARFPVATLRRVVTELGAMELGARRGVPGLEPKRADVIVAGGLVALALLDRAGASTVRMSDRGVRWGLALELAG
jgi:exopolyphosphatase/guanosine-5'-triphosphate,3'-diphosphate pyrophosphatase